MHRAHRVGRACGSRDSSTATSATAPQTTPIGTFTQKIADQSKALDQHAAYHRAEPETEAADRSPSTDGARAMLGIEGMDQYRQRECGHCRATDALQRPERDQLLSSCDSAQPADASVNMHSPARKTRLRPNRSPSVPPTRIKAASTNVYAPTTHSRFAG